MKTFTPTLHDREAALRAILSVTEDHLPYLRQEVAVLIDILGAYHLETNTTYSATMFSRALYRVHTYIADQAKRRDPHFHS